jgi:hypothetical protein
MVGEVVAGRAHFSSLVGLDTERSEVVRYSKTVGFDRVVFVSGFPKERQLAGSVAFLTYPFTTFVWVATLTSLALLWLTLVIDYYVKVLPGQRKSSILSVGNFFVNVLLRPIFDQPCTPPKSMRKVVRLGIWNRILFALWLCVLIVLTSAYKSKIISALLQPYTIHPPKTFEELAESNFKIGAVLFNESVVGGSFRRMKSRMSKEINKRVKGYRYLTPDVSLLRY